MSAKIFGGMMSLSDDIAKMDNNQWKMITDNEDRFYQINQINATARLKASRLSNGKQYGRHSADDLIRNGLPLMPDNLGFDHRVELFFYTRLLEKLREEIISQKPSEWQDKRLGEIDRMIQEINRKLDLDTFASQTTDSANAKNRKSEIANQRTSQLHVLVWNVYQHLISEGRSATAQKIWNEIQMRHKEYDNESIIQEVDAYKISWVSGFGNEQEFMRSSFDSLLSRLKRKSQS